MRALLLLAAALAGCVGTTGTAVVETGTVQRVEVIWFDPAEAWTPAEATDYARTASYDETVDFIGVLTNDHAFRVGFFGQTVEGRDMPYVAWPVPGTPTGLVTDVQTLRQPGKTRVLVIGGIHAGEPAGKDAMLALLRDLAAGQHRQWADSLTLLVAPIYNADGAERVAFTNRPLQWGPIGGMGVRPNADGLDLNRDFVKAASPEARAMIALMRDFDPHVVIDLHTTNGTAMGYHLTYAPGLHPDTPAAIDRDLRDRWLPSISDSLLAQDGYATYHYGNVPGAFGEPATAPRGWYSFSAQPRFSTNYAGLRGRYAILSEAYSYANFRDRVTASRRFVEEVLDRVWAEASHVRETTAAADRQSVVGKTLAVRATWDALPQPVEILLGEVDTLRHPTSGEPMLARRDVRIPETMPAFVRFAPSETAVAPSAYVIHHGPHQQAIADLLDLHGVRYSREAVWGVARQRFAVDSLRVAERPFQGVAMQEVYGRWVPVPAETGPMPRLAPALVVPVGQPLGRLAVTFLEPRSDDGVVAWAVVPLEALALGTFAPIERIPSPTDR